MHDWQAVAAVGIFVVAYAIIAWDKVHRTVVALAGGALMLLLRIVGQREALHGVEGEPGMGVQWNTIFLLIGMMIIVNMMRETGVFQWLAIRSAKTARGNPIRILLLLSAVTALLSAFLDNVTTVLLIAPVTILIAESLDVDPVPFLICEVLASNIGGTATLIGDPPNIMIGSATGFTFVDFVIALTPVVVVVFVAFAATIWLALRKRLVVSEEKRALVMAFDESEAITDRPLLVKSLIILGLTLVGFVVHGALHLEPATIALAGAALLLVVSAKHPLDYLQQVEWPTIFFFIGIFIMVSGLVQQGVMGVLASSLVRTTHGSPVAIAMVIVWVSLPGSGIVGSIPYTATVIPVLLEATQQLPIGPVESLSQLAHHGLVEPLWWALALGACLGGNVTILGAAANVVVADISEKAGYRISFSRFLKYGLPLTVQSLIISTLYILLLLKLSGPGTQ